MNLRKLYEVEKYHQKLAVLFGQQFSGGGRQAVKGEIVSFQERLNLVQTQLKKLIISGNLSKELLDRHGELKGKIDALWKQNEAYLLLTELQDQKSKADEIYESFTKQIFIAFDKQNAYMLETQRIL